ncbi:MAG: hypothetical protein C0467_24400 [Planctomycetaceae bacterium]|nr:hypothetical protein [Planctomycetaceae bacterium]
MNPSRDTTTENTDGMGANPGYVLGQLAKAFQTNRTHADADTRNRAGKKIETWVKVFEGMLSGALQVGSHTPIAGTPAWATLEVAHGGFATGELLAGGALKPHEQELLSRLSLPRNGAERATLNAFYLSDAGIAELRSMLASGCYRVTVPEEGALLVVAWLLDHGNLDAARSVLDEIGPFFSRLRFYPVPDPTPLVAGAVVHLQDVGQTIENLKAIRVPTAILAQREALQVWVPLYDRVTELFVETVEGAIPTVRLDPEGKRLKDTNGRCVLDGGWPCQRYPDGWKARASAVLADYKRLLPDNKLCKKHQRGKRNFARLRGYLETCVKDPRRLSGRDVGMIRVILAGISTDCGLPGSPRFQQRREIYDQQLAAPSRTSIAKVLIDRLAIQPQGDGLYSLDGAMSPVNADEAGRYELKVGQVIPESFTGKLQRCLAAPVSVLVEAGVIPSSEVLARAIPQITAQVRAAGISNPDLRRLYVAIYTAFRRRRSLLVLNLQSQVKLAELPWVQAIDGYRQGNLQEQEQGRQTLEQVVTLAITAFPQQILPNKFLQEVRALAETAGLKLPIVDEIAADIFMGEFSEKFLLAAQKAGELLAGSLYERYYAIPYDRVCGIDDVKRSRYGTPTSPAFADLCVELAGKEARGRSVAHNGKIIEQEQILTTHNLAVLFTELALTESLRPQLSELAKHCFKWICRRLQMKTTAWQSRLRMVKNAAYAWRQMTFFLALLRAETVTEFLAWATEHLGKQPPEFRDRFEPTLVGLRSAARDVTLDAEDAASLAGKCFLGWTTTKHWLFE